MTTFSDNYSNQSTIFGKNTFLSVDFGSALNDNVIVLGSSRTEKKHIHLLNQALFDQLFELY